MSLSSAAADAMLAGLASAIEGGTISYYTGPAPIPGGATTLLLARGAITGMPAPSGGTVTLPANLDAQRYAAGTIAWARIADDTGAWLLDLVVGVTGSGTPIELDSLTGNVGGFVQLTTSTVAIA